MPQSICRKCRNRIRFNDEQLGKCRNCGEPILGSHGHLASANVVGADSASSRARANAALRYHDAYLVARATDGIGGGVKIVGFILGAAIAFFGFAQGSANGGNNFLIVGGIILAAVITVPFYVLGVLVSANAQALKASLDAAVHTSPFLTDADKASVMSLE